MRKALPPNLDFSFDPGSELHLTDKKDVFGGSSSRVRGCVSSAVQENFFSGKLCPAQPERICLFVKVTAADVAGENSTGEKQLEAFCGRVKGHWKGNDLAPVLFSHSCARFHTTQKDWPQSSSEKRGLDTFVFRWATSALFA